MKLDKFTIGRRYGKALFELAIESNKVEEVYQDLLTIRELFDLLPDIGDILSDVRLEPYEKREVMNTLSNAFQGLVHDFLEVVFAYNRVNDLPFMIDEFELRNDERIGLVHGKVITAVPLTKEQAENMQVSVAKRLGYKVANLKQEIDPTILGGVVVEAKNQVLDGSLKKKVDSLHRELTMTARTKK